MASVTTTPIKTYDDDHHESAGPSIGQYDEICDDCRDWLEDSRELDYDEQRRNLTDYDEWCDCISRDYAGRVRPEQSETGENLLDFVCSRRRIE